jgi:drug/metabolite transporter (DMT)-like permease
MIPLPKPRGFWDYALFALVMASGLMFLFWSEASDRVGWADAAIGLAAAVLFVFATILARRREKAKWITRPTWHVYPLVALGVFMFIFGAIYADAYLLHRRDLTFHRLRLDIVPAVALPAAFVWSARKRFHTKRQVP